MVRLLLDLLLRPFHFSAGFIQVNEDQTWVQPSLASNVSEFLFSYHSSHSSTSGDIVHDAGVGAGLPAVPLDVNHGFVWNSKEGIEKALRGEAGSEEWSRMCMYVSTSSQSALHPTKYLQLLFRTTLRSPIVHYGRVKFILHFSSIWTGRVGSSTNVGETPRYILLE